MRPHLKLQQELFFSFLIDRLIRPIGTAGLSTPAARKGDMESELDASTWNVGDMGFPAGVPMKSVHSIGGGGGERRSSGTLSQSSGPGSSRTPIQIPGSEGRDLMLEYLAQYARASDFMTNLWINYDCNVDCEDLFERLIKFFSRVSQIMRVFVNTADAEMTGRLPDHSWSLLSPRHFANAMPRQLAHLRQLPF